eukprot:scaffold32286_cov89-Skeletonema_dohrnii-CCMP3373.AAC.2
MDLIRSPTTLQLADTTAKSMISYKSTCILSRANIMGHSTCVYARIDSATYNMEVGSRAAIPKWTS